MQFERHVLFWTASALLFAYLVQLLAPVLLPFVVGLTLAYFINPLIDVMGRAGLPRWVSAVLVLAASTFLIILALVFVVPILMQQAAGLIEAAPRGIERLKGLIQDSAREHLGARYPQAENTVRTALDSFTSAMPSLLAGVAQSVWNQSSAAFNFVAVLLVTPIVFFYALLDWPKIVAKLNSWLPRDNAGQIRALAAEINDRVSAFIRGQGAVCLILALFYAAALEFGRARLRPARRIADRARRIHPGGRLVAWRHHGDIVGRRSVLARQRSNAHRRRDHARRGGARVRGP